MPDFAIAQGNLPKLTDTLYGTINIGPSTSPPSPLDLTGCTVQFVFQGPAGSLATVSGNAQIINATAGQVAYTFTTGQTDAPGSYQAQWKVTFASGQILNLPARFIYFDIVDAVPVAASASVTPLRMTIDPVRAVLGDFSKLGKHRYEENTVTRMVRALVQMGELEGYYLTPDLNAIAPVITHPKIFGVLIYKAAKRLLLPNVAAYSYRMRAMSESFGEQKAFVVDLENALYDLQNPTMFGSYQTFYSWLGGVVGLDIWTMMTKMKVDAPIATAEINISGLYINTGSPASPR